MRGLPPRPVSILFLVIMTALLERHVANWCFCCFRFKEVFGQLQEQPWGSADGGEGRTRGRWYRAVTFDPGSREKKTLALFPTFVQRLPQHTHITHMFLQDTVLVSCGSPVSFALETVFYFFFIMHNLWLDTRELITIICKKKKKKDANILFQFSKYVLSGRRKCYTFFYNKNWFYIIKLFLMNHKEKYSNNKLLFLNCFLYIFLYFF